MSLAGISVILEHEVVTARCKVQAADDYLMKLEKGHGVSVASIDIHVDVHGRYVRNTYLAL